MITKLYSFETYKNDLLRTVGLGCIIIDQSPSLNEWGEYRALMLDHIWGDNNQIKAAAKGKVFFVTINNKRDLIENNCYQIKNKRAVNVYCGNSTAATAALLSKITQQKCVSFSFICDDKSIKIECVAKRNKDFTNISQSWELSTKGINLEEIRIGSNKGYKLNLLNDYVFLIGPINRVEHLVKNKIIKSSVEKKVCVIYPGKIIPKIHFYNCNGLHGAAPLTGLVSLSFLIKQIKSISQYFNKMKAITPSSTELIPEIDFISKKNLLINLPNLDVKLSKIFST